jgi:hypothetical protein
LGEDTGRKGERGGGESGGFEESSAGGMGHWVPPIC